MARSEIYKQANLWSVFQNIVLDGTDNAVSRTTVSRKIDGVHSFILRITLVPRTSLLVNLSEYLLGIPNGVGMSTETI
jgi:hypothetical protein